MKGWRSWLSSDAPGFLLYAHHPSSGGRRSDGHGMDESGDGMRWKHERGSDSEDATWQYPGWQYPPRRKDDMAERRHGNIPAWQQGAAGMEGTNRDERDGWRGNVCNGGAMGDTATEWECSAEENGHGNRTTWQHGATSKKGAAGTDGSDGWRGNECNGGAMGDTAPDGRRECECSAEENRHGNKAAWQHGATGKERAAGIDGAGGGGSDVRDGGTRTAEAAPAVQRGASGSDGDRDNDDAAGRRHISTWQHLAGDGDDSDASGSEEADGGARDGEATNAARGHAKRARRRRCNPAPAHTRAEPATTAWGQWAAQATQHIPARSGRQTEHAANGARGDGGGNKGIGKGWAKGTEAGQADYRGNTMRCSNGGCAVLCDGHWFRRGDQHGRCAECRGARGGQTARLHRYQESMAAALESGERRLVELRGLDGDGYHCVWELPRAAALQAAHDARAHVAQRRAHPAKRGRPRTGQRA